MSAPATSSPQKPSPPPAQSTEAVATGWPAGPLASAVRLEGSLQRLEALETMLALGFVGGRVMLVDETTGKVRWLVEAHRGEHSAAWAVLSPDNGRFLASVGRGDAQWKLWDAVSGDLHMVGAMHDGTGACTCEELDLDHPAFQER